MYSNWSNQYYLINYTHRLVFKSYNQLPTNSVGIQYIEGIGGQTWGGNKPHKREDIKHNLAHKNQDIWKSQSPAVTILYRRCKRVSNHVDRVMILQNICDTAWFISVSLLKDIVSFLKGMHSSWNERVFSQQISQF